MGTVLIGSALSLTGFALGLTVYAVVRALKTTVLARAKHFTLPPRRHGISRAHF
jgi:hypothetical protein